MTFQKAAPAQDETSAESTKLALSRHQVEIISNSLDNKSLQAVGDTQYMQQGPRGLCIYQTKQATWADCAGDRYARRVGCQPCERRLPNKTNNRGDAFVSTEKNIVIMPCLDMQNGRVVKGVQFVDIRDAGDPAECCMAYCAAGADEIAMLDITATVEGRATMLDVVRRVAEVATIPLTVGGGINDPRAAAAVLQAGAHKISTSSAAFRNPAVIQQMVAEFGAARVTVAIDAARNPAMPSGYEVFIDGGRTATGTDAVEWAKTVAGFGVQTILPTSKSTDGVKNGYDLPLIRAIKAVTSGDVVAHFCEAVEAGATILLAASVFHFKTIGIPELKQFLASRGVPVRLPGANNMA